MSVDLRPMDPAQGDTVLVTVETAGETVLSGRFEGRPVVFLNQGSHHWGLVGIHPMEDVGPHDLTITSIDAGQKVSEVVGQIWVKAGGFQVEDIQLPPDRQKLLDPKLVAAERQRLAAALKATGPLPLWKSRFIYPLSDPVVSSEFGTRRSYNGGPANSYHEGFDFDAREGTPVMAVADGQVAIAEKLIVRGNAVLLDHGLGVHTGYWHLSEIDVKVGQKVKAGDVIAKVGGTGLATGPHLHWEVRIGDVNVNPKQWIQQTFP
jgi:murein DD-endopeptidase MepM/ murein hydrolase activator NlpD